MAYNKVISGENKEKQEQGRIRRGTVNKNSNWKIRM
jgi:hypothetical protein